MSDTSSRSTPLVTILTVLAGFALFAVVVYYAYLPSQTGAYTADGIHTAEARKKNLADLHKKQHDQALAYAWVDKKTGVVQLPLEVAMELTVQKYAAKK